MMESLHQISGGYGGKGHIVIEEDLIVKRSVQQTRHVPSLVAIVACSTAINGLHAAMVIKVSVMY